MRYVPNATRAPDPNVDHVPTAAPYTDRTPASVMSDPRPGDHVTYESICGRITARLGYDDLGAARRLASDPGAVFQPRCLAADPRPGDTLGLRYGHVEEVVEVTAGAVRSIDATGATYTTPLDVWAEGCRRAASCHDRKGGARFDPQPGDRAYAGPDVGWEVTARTGDLLALAHVTTDATATCPVEVWADAGGGAVLFPARYVRAVRA